MKKLISGTVSTFVFSSPRSPPGDKASGGQGGLGANNALRLIQQMHSTKVDFTRAIRSSLAPCDVWI